MNRVTFSKLALLFECAAWARPGAAWAEHAMYEDIGNAVDKPFAEWIRTGGKVDAFTAHDDEKAAAIWRAARTWLEDNYVVGMRAQVVYAYNPETDTGREIEPLPEAPERFYAELEWRAQHGILDREICGAADIQAMGMNDGGCFVAIDDLKVRLGIEVKDATAQLSGLALAACRAYGVTRARIRTLVADERGIWPIEQWLEDEFALDEVAGQIVDRLDRVEAEEPPHPGEWCTDRYCPHIADCPAKQQDVEAAEQLVPVDALVRRRADGPLTLRIQSPDHAADVLARARAVERVAEMLKKAVAAYVGDEGVRLSDGSTLMPTFRNMPRVNHAKIEQLAKDHGATDEEIAMCVSVVREGAGIKVVGAAKAKRGRAA